MIGNGDLANVVHGAAEPYLFEFGFVPAERAGEGHGVFGDAHGVALGVWVSGFNRDGEGGDDGAVADLEHFAAFEQRPMGGADFAGVQLELLTDVHVWAVQVGTGGLGMDWLKIDWLEVVRIGCGLYRDHGHVLWGCSAHPV